MPALIDLVRLQLRGSCLLRSVGLAELALIGDLVGAALLRCSWRAAWLVELLGLAFLIEPSCFDPLVLFAIIEAALVETRCQVSVGLALLVGERLRVRVGLRARDADLLESIARLDGGDGKETGHDT